MPTDVSATYRSTRATRHDHPSENEEAPRPARSDASPSCPTQDRLRDRTLAEACRNAPAAAWKEAPRAPTNDRILYVGMNKDSSGIESCALAARSVGLTTIESSASSTVTFEGHEYDLSSEMGAHIFAAAVGQAYGLDADKSVALGDALAGTDFRGRDELARIALAWAPAEKGAVVASRMILSGHSAGGFLMGGHGGSEFRFDNVLALAKALPAAARQIEDIQLSGCFTENQVQDASKWTAAFPNLKTLWGYSGFSPGAPIGHLYDWEAATRGRTSTLGDRFVAAHGAATAWSLNGGIANAGKTLEERRGLVVDADRHFDAFLSGDRRITDPHQPDADRAYGAYRMLAAHSSALPAERSRASLRADQMLRLRFYEKGVRTEFAQKHGAAIARVFERLGLPRADFSELSRKEALEVVRAFRERAGGNSDPEVARVRHHLDGLAELSPNVIPTGWCH